MHIDARATAEAVRSTLSWLERDGLSLAEPTFEEEHSAGAAWLTYQLKSGKLGVYWRTWFHEMSVDFDSALLPGFHFSHEDMAAALGETAEYDTYSICQFDYGEAIRRIDTVLKAHKVGLLSGDLESSKHAFDVAQELRADYNRRLGHEYRYWQWPRS